MTKSERREKEKDCCKWYDSFWFSMGIAIAVIIIILSLATYKSVENYNKHKSLVEYQLLLRKPLEGKERIISSFILLSPWYWFESGVRWTEYYVEEDKVVSLYDIKGYYRIIDGHYLLIVTEINKKYKLDVNITESFEKDI